MTSTYSISTGVLLVKGLKVGTGYSGHGASLNNPTDIEKVGVGPLPIGTWQIGPWHDDPHLGPLVSHLTPVSVANLYGRSGFYIHGDNALLNHTGSDGCIVLSLTLRKLLRDAEETYLVVIR